MLPYAACVSTSCSVRTRINKVEIQRTLITKRSCQSCKRCEFVGSCELTAGTMHGAVAGPGSDSLKHSPKRKEKEMTTHQDLPKRVIFGYQRITIGPWEKLTKTSKSFATVNPCVGTLGKSNNTLSHCGFLCCANAVIVSKALKEGFV